jgi:hypothetical protein
LEHEFKVSFVDQELEAVVIIDELLEDGVSIKSFLKVVGVLFGHLFKECCDHIDFFLVEDLHHFIVAFFSLGFVSCGAFSRGCSLLGSFVAFTVVVPVEETSARGGIVGSKTCVVFNEELEAKKGEHQVCEREVLQV